MLFNRVAVSLGCLGLAFMLVACSVFDDSPVETEPLLEPTATVPPTPSADVVQVSGIMETGARLSVRLPSIKLLNYDSSQDSQLFLALIDPAGTHTSMIYPANRRGQSLEQFDLSAHPLEISLSDDTDEVVLWILAVHNVRYRPAERVGLNDLAEALGDGFHDWLTNGDPADDPLAAIVSASEGALYDWFANIDVLGQEVITISRAAEGWPILPSSQDSADGGLSTVFDVEFISTEEVARQPTPTPTSEAAEPSYQLVVDDTFPGGRSTHKWFENQDATYTNHLTNGAYEIQITAIEQSESGLSWGSMEGEWYSDYQLEARVRLVEEDVVDGRYGIWFNYQDDYNFAYFGIRNTGEYRIAIIDATSSNRIEIQDWTSHDAINPGAATNTLTIDSAPDGSVVLGINGEEVHRFTDTTFTEGSIAFFCYAESVPATCRLERLRIWTTAPTTE